MDAGEEARTALVGLLKFAGSSDALSVARRLLAHHGSVGGIFAALPDGITPLVPDLPAAVGLLGAARAVMPASLKEEFASAPLARATTAVDYLRGSMAYGRRVMLRILYVDYQHRLILDETAHCGSRSGVYVPASHIVRKAAALDASGILIAHNHLSGNPRPSTRDRLATRSLAAKLSVIGVTLHDHMIFARSGWVSFRALGLIPDVRGRTGHFDQMEGL